VITRDGGILPLQSRWEEVADKTELNDVYETERHLFYFACTRARDRLLITAVRPASEYIQDLGKTFRPSRRSGDAKVRETMRPKRKLDWLSFVSSSVSL
jgi:superfamily I DNA/RNA helicase